MIAIGIDIGGTSIKGAAIREDGSMMSVFSMPVVKGEPGEETINKLIDLVEQYIKENGLENQIEGIGIGIPGLLDVNRGVVSFAGNLNWVELPVADLFKKRLPYRVRIANDANVAAYGEALLGAGKGQEYVVMLTLGTGVGGGIVLNGKLFEGNEGKGAEMGHITMEFEGRQCTCGRKGCLETYASATALIRDTKEAMEKDPNSLMHEVAKELGIVDARVAFIAEGRGDKAAKVVVDNYVKYLSEGLLNYCNIFRPNIIVLSGGVANEGENLLGRVREYMKAQNYGMKRAPVVEIRQAAVGYDAGKIGAAALYF